MNRYNWQLPDQSLAASLATSCIAKPDQVNLCRRLAQAPILNVWF